jgi:TnpA family transposase
MKQKKSQRRRFILTELEQQFYYQRPIFDDEDRDAFFRLDEKDRSLIKNISPASGIYTILQLGYFKAKQQFFQVTYPEVQYDIHWIQYNYYPSKTIIKKLPSRNIQTAIKNKIAKAMEYQTNTTMIKVYLIEQAKFFAKQYNDPAIIFKELFLCLKHNKMLLPGYTTVQDIISQASNQEEKRLLQILSERLTASVKDQLENLLSREKEKLNKIRDLKQDLSGFNYTAMKQQIYLHKDNESLYQFSKTILPDFQISEQNIHYYADCINYYSTYELTQLQKPMYYLYLLCYIYHRYQKMDDNLAQAFMYQVDKIKKSASKHASAVFLQEQRKLLADPKSIGRLIGNYANEPLLKSRKVFNEVAEEAYKFISKEKIAEISEKMMSQADYQTTLEWQYYREHRQFMELNLRPIFRALTFQADKNDHPLLEAINFLKNIFDKKTPITKVPSSKFPQKVIPKKFKEIIIDTEGKIRPYHYEFLVYYKLKDYLVKNIIYLKDSIQYKSFNDDVKNNLPQGKNKEKFLQQMNKQKLAIPLKERLPILEKEIETLLIEVNENIVNGSNKSIKVKTINGETTWTLKYPATEKEFNHKFYEKLPVANIADVYDFVHDECGFTSVFKHFRVKNVKGELEYQAIKGGLIAIGTRKGIVKMASESNLDLETLRRNKQNYITEKAIRAACKKIIKKMMQLPIIKHYMIQGKHFAGIDGSKKGTAKKNAKARHSPKYFGLSRGLSVMSMLMDNMIVNSDYISCNEYEGHHLYDLYFNHDAEFDPDVIATDSHGSNKMNFSLMDFLDIELAICYKNIFEKSKQISGFKPLENYKDMMIKPNKKFNTDLIIRQDENIRNMFIAILSKTTKQSVLIKKLCNHGRKTVLKKALWEYNNIFFTRFLLKYINDPILRKHLRIILNRIEASNKFYNTIVKIGGKKFKGKSEIEIGLENQATRLLMLIISFYNMYILSAAIEKKQKDDEAVDILANISPLATQNLNLSGTYHYGEGAGIDIKHIITALTEVLDNFQHKKEKKESEAREKEEKEKNKAKT